MLPNKYRKHIFKKRLITYIDFCLITEMLEASLTMTEPQLPPPNFLWPPIRLLYLSLKRRLLQSLSLWSLPK